MTKVILSIIVFFAVSFIHFSALAQEQDLNTVDEKTTQLTSGQIQRQMILALEFYNSGQHESSIALLSKILLQNPDQPSAKYLMGLNYYKIKNYDLAEKFLTEVTTDNSIKEISKAYYYLGLTQYEKNDYEKAASSFELSIDTSDDPEHDKKAEKLIERSLRKQEQKEREKQKSTLAFGANYSMDSNVLNVKENQDESNSGHVLGLNAYYAYKYKYNDKELIEPSVYFANTYTVDEKFKAQEDIQSADYSMLVLSIPYRLNNGSYVSTTSFSTGLYMLPTTENTRELSILLLFLTQNYQFSYNSDLDYGVQFVIGRDQSQLDYTNAEDNQTAIKYEVTGKLNYNFPNTKNQTLAADLGIIYNDADGVNSSYHKLYTNLSYELLTWKDTETNIRLTYGSTDYTQSELERKDQQLLMSITTSKDLSDRTNLSFFISSSQNTSTVDNYKYNDYQVGLQYYYLLKF